jgi:hypothetical protein
MFDVYFGEPGTDEPVSANNGEIVLYVQDSWYLQDTIVSKKCSHTDY